jgi:hypothetical protein
MADKSSIRENSTEVLIGTGLLLATAVIFALGLVLIWFASLRENQVFWTNAGGFPILLRDLVRWTFVPLLIATAIALLGLSMACFSKLCGSARFIILESLMLLLCWGLLATAGYIAFKNNIHNIILGTPLHRHEESETTL